MDEAGGRRGLIPTEEANRLVTHLLMKLSGNRTEADIALESRTDAQGASLLRRISQAKDRATRVYLSCCPVFCFPKNNDQSGEQ